MVVLGATGAAAATGCRVMSWNLNGGCAIYGNCDPNQAPRDKSRWATAIANQDFPSVIGLQEVCEGPGRRDVSELVSRLAAAGQSYQYYFQTTHKSTSAFRDCGNAILSILPMRKRTCVWLSFNPVRGCSSPGSLPPSDCAPDDCRVALSAIVDVPAGTRTLPVRIFTTHTAGGAFAWDSQRQTRAVSSWVASFTDAVGKVVTGDFQNGNALHDVFDGFWDAGFDSAVNADGRTPLTHSQDSQQCPPPAGELGSKPDYIWSDFPVSHWFAPCVTSATSDHFPLVADVGS